MPYTPPSAQSPASSQPASPTLSRTSSYHQDDIPKSPVASRPQPPRSHSSASYLHKHRRSPSITTPEDNPPPRVDASDASNISAIDFARLGSIRQSPPPVSNLRMPSGAVISPPDSSENSDGDEGSTERGRELEKSWDQLQLAVRALPQKRDGSPEKVREHQPQAVSSEPVSQSTSPTALSAEARKISHSRSSTETKIVLRTATFAPSPNQTDDSDEDDGIASKPSLVRKKSGELVKPALRPSSRRRYSSMPGTPTYSKSVHFNDSDNQTRHFLQVDKPIAVSAGSSPVETYDSESEFPFEDGKAAELEIKIADFPEETVERRLKPVRIKSISLSADKTTLVGVTAVQNIAFQKQVVARFTLDYWKTTSEVVAEYSNDGRNRPSDGCDRFNFHIKLTDQANIDTKTLLLCVRYTVGGQDFWDNNNGSNYQVDFTRGEKKKAKPKQVKSVSAFGQRQLNAIPRSRHTAAMTRGRPESIDDDFASHLDIDSPYDFSSPHKILGDSNSSIKLKPKSRRPLFFASGASTAPTNGLGSRYDFGTSLSAALSTTQSKGDRHMEGQNEVASPTPTKGGYFRPLERTEPTQPDIKTERPDTLTGGRPAIGSDQYKDLVQKFCYFTPGSGKGISSPQTSSPITTPTQQQQKASSVAQAVGEVESVVSSTKSSGTSSPAPEVDGANDYAVLSPVLSTLKSRSSSPGPVTGQGRGARAASPVSFGYPYHSGHRDGYLSDTLTPTAIHG